MNPVVSMLPFILGALSWSEVAHATDIAGNCGGNDSPPGFQNKNCLPPGGAQKMCYDNGTQFVCDLELFADCEIDGNTVWAVSKYGSSTHAFSAWGTCDGTQWCCTLDDSDADVVEFIVYGTNHDEELMSFHVGTTENMAAHRALDRLWR